MSWILYFAILALLTGNWLWARWRASPGRRGAAHERAAHVVAVLSPGDQDEIAQLVRAGRKIEAIVMLRTKVDTDLPTAKRVAEALAVVRPVRP